MTTEEKDLLEVGIKQLSTPLRDFLKTVFGETAAEIGKGLANEVRARRFVRAAALMSKVQDAIRQRGIDPTQIPDYIAVPFLEAASLVDDDYLREKWANLLTSAADPAKKDAISPSFPHILSQLSAAEAKLLEMVLQYVDGVERLIWQFPATGARGILVGPEFILTGFYQEIDPEFQKNTAISVLRDGEMRLGEIKSNLSRNELIAIRPKIHVDQARSDLDRGRTGPVEIKFDAEYEVFLTPLGYRFGKACRSTNRK